MTIIILCAVIVATSTIAAVFITASVILNRMQRFNDQMLILSEKQTTANGLCYQLLLKNFFHVLENLHHTYTLEIRECEKSESYERCAALFESLEEIRKAQSVITIQLNATK